ncbi:hypothetical protein [Bradyrhizobium canariense]|uniref:Uncharacterized protein n=1 Tax=Bradyrhizobium canariense TaxID=255045 RepID=A0A1H1MA01_9BRAD|nr:hypothetical protein [Bradyrhizobium canariense]SDR83402.1 hypothetical protein SAMN05444158_0145 [Bradyrhizobium canariense]
MNQGQPEEYSLSPLQTFFAKVAIVTGALLTTLYFASSLAVSFVTTQSEQLKALKGGAAFWGAMEQKLYTLADAPDIAPEKKQKIIDAIHRLSLKYKPYFDALNDDGAPGKPERAKPDHGF